MPPTRHGLVRALAGYVGRERAPELARAVAGYCFHAYRGDVGRECGQWYAICVALDQAAEEEA